MNYPQQPPQKKGLSTLAIVLIVVGVTLVGESLNDVLNPLLRTRKLRQVVLPKRASDAA